MRIVVVSEGAHRAYVVYWLGQRHGRRRDPEQLLRLVRSLIPADAAAAL